ncbi:MAG: LuxR C-terminal-related transcriptional regulator [Rhodothermales bacterium]
MTEPDGRPPPALMRLLDALPFPAALLDEAGCCLYCNAAHQQHPACGGRAATPPGAQSGEGGDKHAEAYPAWVVQARPTPLVTTTRRDAGGGVRCYHSLRLSAAKATGKGSQVLIVELGEVAAPGDLAGRELEVFEHLGHGRTTAEIAEAMVISPKTVESYRARIKEKLGARHNTELIQRAVQWVEGTSPLTERGDLPEAPFINQLVQEIRSPLAAIVGLTDVLMQHGAPEQARTADLIRQSAEQLVHRLDAKLKDIRHDRPGSGGNSLREARNGKAQTPPTE